MTDKDTDLKSKPGPKKVRAPSQERSRVRFERILDAATRLLIRHETEDVGIYEIAAEASVSPQSVYFFFPNVDCLVAALSDRYNFQFLDELKDKTVLKEVETWQQFFRWVNSLYYDFQLRNIAYLRIVNGPYVGRQVACSKIDVVRRLAQICVESLGSRFRLPDPVLLVGKVSNAVFVSNTLWRVSYLETGEITDEAFRESQIVLEAYLQMYLPSQGVTVLQ